MSQVDATSYYPPHITMADIFPFGSTAGFVFREVSYLQLRFDALITRRLTYRHGPATHSPRGRPEHQSVWSY